MTSPTSRYGDIDARASDPARSEGVKAARVEQALRQDRSHLPCASFSGRKSIIAVKIRARIPADPVTPPLSCQLHRSGISDLSKPAQSLSGKIMLDCIAFSA